MNQPMECPTCGKKVRFTEAQSQRVRSVVELVTWALEARKRYEAVIEAEEKQEAVAVNAIQVAN
jgi:hypothetical protein